MPEPVRGSAQEQRRVEAVLERNGFLDFVKRIRDPGRATLPNPDGSSSTHKMAWGTDENGRAFVFPTIITGDDGELVRMPPGDAMRHALSSGEFISARDAREAAWLSERYKLGMPPAGEKKSPRMRKSARSNPFAAR